MDYFVDNSSKPTMIFQFDTVTTPVQPKKDKKAIKSKITNPLKEMNISKANFKKEMRTFKTYNENAYFSNSKIPSTSSQLQNGQTHLLLPLVHQIDSKNNPDGESQDNNGILSSNTTNTNINEVVKPLEVNELIDDDLKALMENKTDRINHLLSTNEEENGALSESVKSDESKYVMLGDGIDIMIECYVEESPFIDIHEVKKKLGDFEIVYGDKNLMMDVEQIILPKKDETRVGEAYQAKIINRENKYIPNRNPCPIWRPERIKREELDDYLKKLYFLTGLSKENVVEEKALEPLIDNNYNSNKALKFCYANLGYIKARIAFKKKKTLI